MLYILLTPHFTSEGSIAGTWHAADEMRSTERQPYARCGESAVYPLYLSQPTQPTKFVTNPDVIFIPPAASFYGSTTHGQHAHEPQQHQHDLVLAQVTRLEAVLHSHFRPDHLCIKCAVTIVEEESAPVDTFRTPRRE